VGFGTLDCRPLSLSLIYIYIYIHIWPMDDSSHHAEDRPFCNWRKRPKNLKSHMDDDDPSPK
jgi:hypothetical protein